MKLVGVDTGGTFTDVLVYDTDTGAIDSSKWLTTAGDESTGIIRSLDTLIRDHGLTERLIHGTTIGTNAILERKVARTSIVTTKGFRDLLEIGRTRRMVPNSMFDLRFQKPAPLVQRKLRFEVTERLLASGSVHLPLDEGELVEICEKLRAAETDSVAVCFLHSYANAEHEETARECLEKHLPGVFISNSSDVVPEYREFERLTTTVLNASIGPILDRYIADLEAALLAKNASTKLFIMTSNGGMNTAHATRQMPVHTVLSGPAGGVVASLALVNELEIDHAITCDMGGTSTDVCLIKDRRSEVTTDNLIADLPLKKPQIDMKTVGAGGGSIASVSPDGEILVGPQSAGSDPGPICYGGGGTSVTVTDANLFLNRLTLRTPLGGQITPQVEKVGPALNELASRSSVNDATHMAAGIVRIAVAKMVASIREISVFRGHDPQQCALIAFGGAGPMHATAIADELGVTQVIIPRYPGHFSAWGLLTSDVRRDFVETLMTTVSEAAIPNITDSFSRLGTAAKRSLLLDGFDEETITCHATLDLRYKGQAFELSIDIDPEQLSGDHLAKQFHDLYASRYGHANADQVIEIVNARMVGLASTQKPQLPDAISLDKGEPEYRSVFFDEQINDVPVIHRSHLNIDEEFSGPAIIEEHGSTTVVFPHWNLRRTQRDVIILNLKK